MRSDLTGWTIGYALPAALFVGQWQRAGWLITAGAVLSLILAISIAIGLSRRIATPMSQLASAAAAIGGTSVPKKVESTIEEVMALSAALNRAAIALVERDQHLRRSDEELRQQASDLRQANANKSRFLALLSHELRNPLAPLRTGLAILSMQPDPKIAGDVNAMMTRQVSHMARLIDDLLDVSRLSLDKLTLRVEVTDLAAIVEHAVEACRPTAERAGHVLEVSIPDEPVRLHGDRARLAQVFANLIGNACKFTPDGGRIVVAARREGESAVVSVKDDGIGIDGAEIDRVFEMFAQVDHSLERSRGGLGIGLTLVRRLVEMHGGSVAATSAGLDHGSEFVVTLPLASELCDAAVPVIASPPQAKPPASRLQILVVDDNGDSADSLALLLSLSGHETHIARDGPQALARAEALRPQAILLDLGLPGLSGYEVCRRLREAPWTASTPIIAITGWGQDDDRQRSKEAGFDGHLVKPIVLAELTALLGERTVR